jgi:hypothetical protein
MAIGWNFPTNNYGVIYGLKDAGTEIFKGNPLTSLTREVIQNSIDAHNPQLKRPVEVLFSYSTQPIDRFPGRAQFIKTLQACKEYWKQKEDYVDFFENALQILNKSHIDVLKISDYNTIGLTKSNGNWENLIKSSGVSAKDKGSLGSFGIGKKAVFANTPLKVSFYSSKDTENNKLFQGVADLVTHPNPANELTQGTGYYGNTDRNEPVVEVDSLDPFFNRSDTGLDIFIFGFQNKENWKLDIINSVIDNFFVAIHEEKLIVTVDDIAINKNSLKPTIDRFSDHSKSQTANYYKALTSELSFVKTEEFEGMGQIELRLLEGDKFIRKIAMLRKTGMLIYPRERFQTPTKFVGIFQAKGEEINEFLRSIENPQHNLWEADRHKDVSFAKRSLDKINKWISNAIKELSGDLEQEEYDFEGMYQFLPDDLSENSKNIDLNSDDRTIPQPVEIIVRKPKTPNQSSRGPASETSKDGSDGFEDQGSGGDGKNTGGEIGVISSPGSEKGEGASSADESGNLNAPKIIPMLLKKTRAFCSNPGTGEYKIIFESDKKVTGFIGLNIVGEVTSESAQIQKASWNNINLIPNSKGQIGPIDFDPTKKSEILIHLKNNLHCALEVLAYESR